MLVSFQEFSLKNEKKNTFSSIFCFLRCFTKFLFEMLRIFFFKNFPTSTKEIPKSCFHKKRNSQRCITMSKRNLNVDKETFTEIFDKNHHQINIKKEIPMKLCRLLFFFRLQFQFPHDNVDITKTKKRNAF